ncbi:type I polyketide synthase [Haloactinomyces albus]|uniref:Acyl transferase domain-containing protein n=1 Tax=Haloactinomyces albus TaxID=1352928 RepID=A0AAE3ZHF1_9ACTN|nr:type I polyketide synthase [Haloactinomyces albus]MDR7303664.1 acyl transferase domain-containing protein [Haloactinomyces albus]
MSEKREAGHKEPIAVIGTSCRLPRASNPDDFWKLLRDGVDTITEPPENRWESDEDDPYFGGFLENVGHFDASFFGISPREAASMDPQQRIILELAWSALENARICPGDLEGTRTAVFVGSIWDDYSILSSRLDDRELNQHSIIGSHRGIIANRVSYALGLRGPSMVIDTGQSSSLVAVHNGCESLHRGESSLAIVGGVNLTLAPESTVRSARFGGLSPDGRCFTFDARANGYVRGEGAATVVLKPLSHALRDGNPVLCTILGSAVNNDGATFGLTVPGREGQEEVLREAYEQAGVDPGEVQYVELHGTGTRVGDPIEAAALGNVLGDHRTSDSPLLVGSAKTNVGHLEGAAGITGFLKTALSIAHRQLPASLNFETPNPEIPLDTLGLRVCGQLDEWPDEQQGLVAGVSSFGMGGTNCHVVLAEAPKTPSVPSGTEDTDPKYDETAALPWVLSAKTKRGLAAQAARLRSHLEERPDLSVRDVAYSLATTRTHFTRRAAVVAADRDRGLAGLHALATNTPSPDVLLPGTATRSETGKKVFVFPGQGSQWAGMARDLVNTSPVFTQQLHACAEALAPHTDWDLLETITTDHGAELLDRVDVVQPALWAMMISLATLWRAHGIEPDAVLGHSQGEIAAAHIAGALSLDDSARIIALRSQAIRTLAGTGGMASINLPAHEIHTRLQTPHTTDLHIAAINSPTSTVIAGPTEQITTFLTTCNTDNIHARTIAVDYASHSPHVAPARHRILTDLAPITPQPATIPFHSTVTGTHLNTTHLDATYWYNNLANTVHFHDTAQNLTETGHTLFIEISPHPVLTTPLTDTLENTPATTISTLRRHEHTPTQFTTALTQAHLHGHSPTWTTLTPHAHHIELPTYAFQRRHYWLQSPTTTGEPIAADSSPATPSESEPESDLADASLRKRLSELSGSARQNALVELVAAQAAAVLGHTSPEEVDVDLNFKELGLESLGAVELRDRLNTVTGLDLPSTVIYARPTLTALAERIEAELFGAEKSPAGGAPVEAGVDEPIAIVATSCRYPGGVRSAEDLWQLLIEGRDAISGFPDNRGWNLDSLDRDEIGKSYVNQGGFLYEADLFDAQFFGISPREAAAMDPQQRLLLETSWEAFEHAGLAQDELPKQEVGVFVGAMPQDYGPRMHERANGSEGYLLTGNTGSVASGRIAYTFGFEGPAVTVDTACSSSLVALHMAVQALRGGECKLALACGTTVMSNPGIFVEFSRQGGLAPDGRCKAFSAEADGTGWAEGVGVLLLERLSEAQANGHQILGLVRGSAVNQDGASNGLTAPNGPSQERVIRQALTNARLTPADIDAVEAHGTGTTLGDPIEAQALQATYGHHHTPQHPLWLGSLKSNIGHTQAAAGVGGIIKMIQALRHRTLPQTLHAHQPTPHIDWHTSNLALLTQPQPWTTHHDQPRRAAISSFGISGTNAHIILEQAPTPTDDNTPNNDNTPTELPLVLSAKNETALHHQAHRLATFLRHNPHLHLRDIAYSLATTRTHFEHRAAIIATDRQQALTGLEALSDNAQLPEVLQGNIRRSRGGLAFVFSGQGSQRVGMGRELHATFPVFAETVDEICTRFDAHLETPLRAVMFADSGSAEADLLDRTVYTQAALFTIECALYRLYEDHGLVPDAVIGHSIGEITAAHVAGVLSLTDAVTLIAARGQTMQAARDDGAMVAIAAGESEVLAALEEHAGRVTIAAVNAPEAVVVSGDADIAESVGAHFTDQGRKARRLNVSHAFHSPHMDSAVERFGQALSEVELHEPRTPLVSNVTGRFAEPGEPTDPEYWAHHIRRPVRFADGITTLAERGTTTYLEIGPDSVLTPMADATLADTTTGATEPLLAAAMRAERPEVSTFLTSVLRMFLDGHRPDWDVVIPHARPVELPTYAFQHQRHWLDTPVNDGDPTSLGALPAQHPLLAATMQLPDDRGWLFTGRLTQTTQPWIPEHAVLDTVLIPGTAYLELASHAAEHTDTPHIDELTLHTPLALSQDTALSLRLHIGEADSGTGHRTLTLHTRTSPDTDAADEWTLHATAILAPTAPEHTPDTDWAINWPPEQAEPVELGGFYERLLGHGYEYGPSFRGLHKAWRHGRDIYAEISLPEDTDNTGYHIHPALLDSALHPLLLDTEDSDVQLPFAWSRPTLHDTRSTHLRARLRGLDNGQASLQLTTDRGSPVAETTLTLRTINPGQLERLHRTGDNGYKLDWTTLQEPPTTGTPDVQVLTGLSLDPAALGDAVPHTLVAPAPDAQDEETPTTAHTMARQAMELVQIFLTESTFDETHLVVTTRGAVSTGVNDAVTNLPASTLWGLVRSAQLEHPERITILDLDPNEDGRPAPEVVSRALATSEPQLAQRGKTLHAPRLSRAVVRSGDVGGTELDPAGTVLITGGTGTLGALIAHHLVTHHDITHLHLTSRRGPHAPGATQLQHDLEQLGAHVTITAADLSDPHTTHQLIHTIPTTHPLTAIIHTAGVLDDTVLTTMTPTQLHTTLTPKVDAAWNLHTATTDHDLAAFILYSSATGTLGNPGQANYAAANTFLDALAHHRHTHGLPATSLAWGLWTESSTLTEGLRTHDITRIRRSGLTPLTNHDGLTLFDTALHHNQPYLFASHLDRQQLRHQANTNTLPTILTNLAPHQPTNQHHTKPHTASNSRTLTEQLAELDPTAQHELLRTTLQTHIAAVLALPDPNTIDVSQGLMEMGFDSLTAVELRNRLNTATGLRLPSTFALNYPTADAMSDYLATELCAPTTGDTAEESADDEKVRTTIATIPVERIRESGLLEPLMKLAEQTEESDNQHVAERSGQIASADVDALIKMAFSQNDS